MEVDNVENGQKVLKKLKRSQFKSEDGSFRATSIHAHSFIYSFFHLFPFFYKLNVFTV